ncbi:MAG: Ig-like domain-containing protein [Kofleriaceae bacterium]|nr:Ig-like domain-containing protein [Kofleriaceae bacterium]
MHRNFAVMAALTVGMVSSAAFAAPRGSYKWTDDSLQNAVYVAPNPAAVSHVIYLNNCKPNGCQLKPGQNNATTNTSTIPQSNSVVQPFTGSDATWNAVVQCVKQTYADFDVQIVTERPTSGNYHMAIVAGTPGNVQQGNGVLGVSPFSCGYISNAISFTFANLISNDVDEICWTVSQETAHSWGLDHKYDNRDPMTYLETGPTRKSFQNAAGVCGEYNARQCSCSYQGTGTAKMNSYAVIMQTFGSSAPDTVPPSVTITFPTEGTQVNAGFPVKTTVTDDRTVEKVTFKLDGAEIKTLTDAPFNFQAPTNLGQGKHKVEVTAVDRGGNATTSTVNVTFGTVCTDDSECTTDGEVCVEGHCVAGPSSEGGLGTPCEANSDCVSGQCAEDSSNSYCVESCDTAASACPSGFACLGDGASGVCWPSNGDGGGCSTSGNHGASLLVLGLGAILITRKRRRA